MPFSINKRSPSSDSLNKVATALELSITEMEVERSLVRDKSEEELKKTSRQIEKDINREKQDRKEFENEPRILILGPYDAGKSTLLKLLKIMHEGEFSPEEIDAFKLQLYRNIRESVAIIVKYIEITKTFSALANYDKTNPGFDSTTRNMIASLWKQVYVQAAFYTKRLPLQDTAAYLLSRIGTLCDPTYQLKDEDILHIKSETVKVAESQFIIDSKKFHFFDVCWQKKRKYWLPYFDNVHSILFVASLASYDLSLAEEPHENQMKESIGLFEEICRVKLLRNVKKYVFLNKVDLFKKKIKVNNVRKFIPTAPAGTNFEELIEYFVECFRQVSDDPVQQKIHITCFTDVKRMAVIINSVVKDSVQNNVDSTTMISTRGFWSPSGLSQ